MFSFPKSPDIQGEDEEENEDDARITRFQGTRTDFSATSNSTTHWLNGTPNLSATHDFTVTVNPLTAPVVTAPTVGGGQFTQTITGQTGPDYTVQVSTNLAESNWATILTTHSPTMPFVFTDTNGSLPFQFYRILVGP